MFVTGNLKDPLRRSGMRSWRLGAALAALSIVAAACSRDQARTISDEVARQFVEADAGAATGALPKPGTMVPPFELRTLREGTVVSKRSMRGQPAVIALWSWYSDTNPVAMQQFDSLARQYNDSRIRFVVLTDHRDDPALDSVLRSRSWRYRVDHVGVGYHLLGNFDRSRDNPLLKGRFAEFRLPSFLLVSQDGQVIRRAGGPPYEVFQPALDSLRAAQDATPAGEDSTTVAALRPLLEQSLLTFDPQRLYDQYSATAVRLDGTCGTQEGSPVGIIPATGRLLDIRADHGAVSAIVEFVSVARVVNMGFGDICDAERVSIRHRVGVDTLIMSIQRVGVDDTSFVWLATGALRRPAGHPGTNVALFSTALELRIRSIEFWPGVAMSDLQARIDSIRRAGHR